MADPTRFVFRVAMNTSVIEHGDFHCAFYPATDTEASTCKCYLVPRLRDPILPAQSYAVTFVTHGTSRTLSEACEAEVSALLADLLPYLADLQRCDEERQVRILTQRQRGEIEE